MSVSRAVFLTLFDECGRSTLKGKTGWWLCNSPTEAVYLLYCCRLWAGPSAVGGFASLAIFRSSDDVSSPTDVQRKSEAGARRGRYLNGRYSVTPLDAKPPTKPKKGKQNKHEQTDIGTWLFPANTPPLQPPAGTKIT